MNYILIIFIIFILVIILTYINLYIYPYILKIKNTNLFYCHIPKTGGTSFNEEFIINPLKISIHYPIINYPINIQKQFIAIVRNPYSRLVSCYEYLQNNEKLYYSKYLSIIKFLGIIDNQSLYIKKISFKDFVNIIINNKINNNFDKSSFSVSYFPILQ